MNDLPVDSMLLAATPPWVTHWLTPLWILGVGVGLGLVILLVIWGVLKVVAPKIAAWTADLVQEGPLWAVFWAAAIWGAFSLVAWMAVSDPQAMLLSVTRIFSVGEKSWDYDIDAPATGAAAQKEGEFAQPISISFRGNEIVGARFEGDQHLLIAVTPDATAGDLNVWDVPADRPRDWARRGMFSATFPNEQIEKLYVQNLGDGPAKLTITTHTQIAYPEVTIIPWTAMWVIVVFALFLLQSWLMPKASAVAHASYKSLVASPLFWVLLFLGVTSILIHVVLPYNTFGEDIKMLKDVGLSVILVVCVIQAVWAASESISDELDGRTALTVLSKPMGRRDFILGKFLGISWTVGVMFIILGIWLVVWVAYKPIYDAREVASDEVNWQLCFRETVKIVPGLVLALLETLVLTAISVAISTRLPLVANFAITGVVYVLGHLTPLIVQSSVGRFAPVRFIGQLIATVFPVLENLNISAAIATGQTVPLPYLGWALLYSLLYGAIAMLLALVLFEDRDLA